MRKNLLYSIVTFMFIITGCQNDDGYESSVERALDHYGNDKGEAELLYKDPKHQVVVFRYEDQITMGSYQQKDDQYKYVVNRETAFHNNPANNFNDLYYTHPETDRVFYYGKMLNPEAEKLTLHYSYKKQEEERSGKVDATLNEQNVYVIPLPLSVKVGDLTDLTYHVYNSKDEKIDTISNW